MRTAAETWVTLCFATLFAATVRALPATSTFSCPDKPPTVSSFDKARYLGNWYAQYTIPSAFQSSGTTCMRARYGVGAGDYISVYNSGWMANGVFDEVCGRASQADPENNPGDLLVEFPVSPGAGNYWLLDTDYESFAVVYSCSEGNFFTNGQELGWLMTRDPNPDQATIDRMFGVLAANGISRDGYERVVHTSDCEYEVAKTCKGEEYPDNPVKRVFNVLTGFGRLAGRYLSTGFKI